MNPFSVNTPENLSPREMVDLFVPYPEYDALQSSGHQFINGHRGSGKSMMLRMMTPDCQMLKHNCELNSLPYFGVYLSIKATEINNPEYIRLESELSGLILSEHVLCTKILSAIFKSVQLFCDLKMVSLENLQAFYSDAFERHLRYVGWKTDISFLETDSSKILADFVRTFDEIQAITVSYVKKKSFPGWAGSYDGPLLGFLDVIVPLINSLVEYKIISCSPIYLLLDDADNLSLQQTKVLNTWVSYRTTATVSLKISTQLGYKTWQTTSGMLIESPHDFSEIYFTAVQTGSPKEKYPKLVADIIEKRLNKFGISGISANSFFPDDVKQSEEIEKIANEIKENWEKNGSGFRPGDDAYRWARPEYIRRLSGTSKQGYRYKYAGFDQLVHISSGIIRFFLDPAAKMYSDQLKENDGSPVLQIAPDIQDNQIRAQASELFLSDFNKLRDDECAKETSGWSNQLFEDLHNLIEGLGNLFQAFIMDQSQTQRRTFSFFISDDPPPNLREIINLGLRYGYFYESSVGKKSGVGRTTLYVLTRRIAPIFKLDPIGFSNHLSLKSSFLLEISKNPALFSSRIKTKGIGNILQSSENQLELSFKDNLKKI